MPLIVEEPLGKISTAEAAALTIIRGVSPEERKQALTWFKQRASQRELSAAVIKAIEKFVDDEQSVDIGKAAAKTELIKQAGKPRTKTVPAVAASKKKKKAPVEKTSVGKKAGASKAQKKAGKK